MRVPTYKKTVTKESINTINGTIIIEDFPERGGTYTEDIDVSWNSNIGTITKVTKGTSWFNLSSSSVVRYQIVSAKKYRLIIENFIVTYSDMNVTHTDDVTSIKSSTETVFKVKRNGTEYNKIKLNGEIITPKA